MRDKFFSMMQQALESTALFVIHMEQECMYQGVDVTTTYHAFVSKLDINMQALLYNVQKITKDLMVGAVSCGQI